MILENTKVDLIQCLGREISEKTVEVIWGGDAWTEANWKNGAVRDGV